MRALRGQRKGPQPERHSAALELFLNIARAWRSPRSFVRTAPIRPFPARARTARALAIARLWRLRRSCRPSLPGGELSDSGPIESRTWQIAGRAPENLRQIEYSDDLAYFADIVIGRHGFPCDNPTGVCRRAARRISFRCVPGWTRRNLNHPNLIQAQSDFDGKPHFSYQNAVQSLQFAGDQINAIETELGALVSVFIRRTIDAGLDDLHAVGFESGLTLWRLCADNDVRMCSRAAPP